MFALLKEANRIVNENCRENLVETRSEKSVGGDVVPSTWHLIFYNPTAKFKATEVIFQRGKMTSKTDPWRMLEIFRADKVLPKEKLKMDSDVALRIAMTNQLLEGVTLKMSEMKLDLQDGVPIWQIQLWAAKNRNPRDMADLGKIFISAENGQVIKNELQPNRIY
jgi:DNA-binding transcriptional regulator/RsmH inhibitor MraZ